MCLISSDITSTMSLAPTRTTTYPHASSGGWWVGYTQHHRQSINLSLSLSAPTHSHTPPQLTPPPHTVLQPSQLTNGHSCLPQAPPGCHNTKVKGTESPKVKVSRSLSCSKSKASTSPPGTSAPQSGTTLSMMVAAEAVPLSDTGELALTNSMVSL